LIHKVPALLVMKALILLLYNLKCSLLSFTLTSSNNKLIFSLNYSLGTLSEPGRPCRLASDRLVGNRLTSNRPRQINLQQKWGPMYVKLYRERKDLS
jgi:hypothetical protein